MTVKAEDESWEGGQSMQRRDRFRRVAASRVEAALKRLRMVRKLSRAGYLCTPAEAAHLIQAISNEVDQIHDAFYPVSPKTDEPFTFDVDDELAEMARHAAD